MKARVAASSLIVAVMLLGASIASAQAPLQPFQIQPSNDVVSPGRKVLFTADSGLAAFGTASAITAGQSHTCALIPNGTVECWGANGDGQLGNGTTTDSTIPVSVDGLTGVTAVSAGGYHTCALLDNGTVECWGWGGFGQLGNGNKADQYVPVPVPGLTGVMAIAAGYEDSCALIADGSVQCWGNSDNAYYSLTPVPVLGVGGGVMTGAVAIAGGTGQGPYPESGHMCVLISDGTVDCWGGNDWGQLGNYGAGPFKVQGVSGVVAIAAGNAHTCAVEVSGWTYCWGFNSYLELGRNGTETNTDIPQFVGNLGGSVISVAAGYGHTCVLVKDGSVSCWGDNSWGEVGNGYTVPGPDPGAGKAQKALISGPAIQVVAGGNHSCALMVDGSVQCWGSNSNGQLGNGSNDDSNVPVTVPIKNLAARGAVRLGIGEYASHSCALLANGKAECWGANGRGQLGIGTNTGSSTPQNVTVTSGIKSMVTGGVRTCAVLADGTAWCWGGSDYGELGDGSNTDSLTAVQVSVPASVLSMSAGGSSCALAIDSTVWCWGSNSGGQLGNGTTTDSWVPTQVIDAFGAVLSGVKAVTMGEDAACALLANGTVDCWGEDYSGQLGTAAAPAAAVPEALPVLGLSGVSEISAGGGYICARLDSGKVMCWGGSSNVGAGPSDPFAVTTSPVQTLLAAPAITMTAGRQRACAVAADGTAQCWGYNGAGGLGDGTTTDAPTPVSVVGLTGTVGITIGDHTCALASNGGVECWGYGYYGGIGNGSNSDQYIPVPTNPLVTSITWTSSQPAIATIDPNTGLATALSDGTTVIGGSDGTFTVTTSLTVVSPTPVITWTPAPINYGSGLSGAQLNASANVPGVFSYTPDVGALLNAGMQTLSVTFFPTDLSSFAITTTTANLQVVPALPSIAVTGGSFTYDGTPHGATAVATGIGGAAVSGSFIFNYNPPGNSIAVPVAAGTYAVTANFLSGDTNYSNASGTGSITIGQTGSSTTITSNTPSASLAGQLVTIAFKVAGVTVPTGSVTVTATTGESCTGALSAGTGSCGITFLTTGTRLLTATYSGDNNFTTSNSKPSTQSVTGPVATVSPTSINFATVYAGSITTKTVTLTNSGTTAMTVTGPLLSIVKGGNSNEFVEVNLCPKSLAAGKSCTMTIAFLAGPYYTTQTATLSVMDNAPGSPQTVALTALVINPQASFSPTSLSFGTQKVSTSVTKVVTLKNSGTTALSLTGMSISGTNTADFSESSTCPSSLAAGSSCPINVTFKPAAKGIRSATLKITDNAQSGSQTVALSGTGN